MTWRRCTRRDRDEAQWSSVGQRVSEPFAVVVRYDAILVEKGCPYGPITWQEPPTGRGRAHPGRAARDRRDRRRAAHCGKRGRRPCLSFDLPVRARDATCSPSAISGCRHHTPARHGPLARCVARPQVKKLRRFVEDVVHLFYESSTRTLASFELAAKRSRGHDVDSIERVVGRQGRVPQGHRAHARCVRPGRDRRSTPFDRSASSRRAYTGATSSTRATARNQHPTQALLDLLHHA